MTQTARLIAAKEMAAVAQRLSTDALKAEVLRAWDNPGEVDALVFDALLDALETRITCAAFVLFCAALDARLVPTQH